MQKRPLFLKADIAISCFNCSHCVDENDDTYICDITNNQIGNAETDLQTLLKCEDGKDWEIDKEVALDFMLRDISSYEILDKNEIVEVLH